MGWINLPSGQLLPRPDCAWVAHGEPVLFLSQQEAEDPEADLDFIVCSLDTLSGVAEALGFRFEGLLGGNSANSALPLRDILLQCCQVRGAQ